MKLKWYGQACFLMTSKTGTHVLTDPFGKGLGYRVANWEADVVTTSHAHFDHNNLKGVKGNFCRVSLPGVFTFRDVTVTGTQTFHDRVLGRKHGSNIVYCFDIDGLRVCHCGDLGHMPTPEQLASIGKADILLLNTGGLAVVTVREAADIARTLSPTVVVPMHYRTRAMGLIGLLFAPVERFLSEMGQSGKRLQEPEIDFSRPADYTGIVLPDYE